MAIKEFATSDALVRKIWLTENQLLFKEAAKESYFLPRFGGESADNIVYVRNELSKSNGDRITFGIRMRLTSTGVGAGQTLEGNEQSLQTYDFSISLDQVREAVRIRQGLTKQRTQIDLAEEARMALKTWMAEKIDALLFAALRTSPTKTFYSNNGTFTSGASYAAVKADLTASQDNITPQIISAMKTWAKTGGNRAQAPLRPIRVDGRETFVFLTHPDALWDLKQTTVWAQAQREAAERGKSNPLFTGAVGVWDNVVIHEHENITIGTDAGSGSNVPFAEGFLMGAQSLCWAWGERGEMVEKTFDYDEEKGFAVNLIYGAGKPVFNGKDYGSVSFLCSRTQVSDI